MARPQKNGLDYFPLDVDIDQDDKIALIEAQHGVIGFAIVIKLLMKIYKNSYFYEWTEKEQLLFSKRINVDINSINVVINDCIKWGLFDSNLLKTKEILTSKGVQARYLEAVGRRTKVEMKKEYLLLDENIVNVYKNLIIVDINSNNEDVSDNINPQSKEKESKEKKSKVNNNKEDSCSSDFNIYRYMQQRGFVTISPLIAEQVQADIDMYSLEEVKQAIDIADNNGKHTYSYVKGILEKRRANGTDGSTRQDTKPSEDKWSQYEFE
ncbi:Lin1244/Lin1753 domain-containing protein [Clostridium nigeriense]|uniref:Lin1244/Lin1753 domain-containing protein n=1 Tax=Clostridium nigeriense TaxID=1805470 RepID=UPI003D32C8C3